MARPFIKLGMYIIAPDPTSTAYFINSSPQSVCLHVYPLLVAQRLGKKSYRCKEYTRNNSRIIWTRFLCGPCHINESRRLVLLRTSVFKMLFPVSKAVLNDGTYRNDFGPLQLTTRHGRIALAAAPKVSDASYYSPSVRLCRLCYVYYVT
jgi:hypothetical protein